MGQPVSQVQTDSVGHTERRRPPRTPPAARSGQEGTIGAYLGRTGMRIGGPFTMWAGGARRQGAFRGIKIPEPGRMSEAAARRRNRRQEAPEALGHFSCAHSHAARIALAPPQMAQAVWLPPPPSARRPCPGRSAAPLRPNASPRPTTAASPNAPLRWHHIYLLKRRGTDALGG